MVKPVGTLVFCRCSRTHKAINGLLDIRNWTVF